MYVKPWNNEIKNVFDRLIVDFRAKTNNTRLPTELGMKYPALVDLGYIDVATTCYRRRKERKNYSLFQLPSNVRVIPRNGRYLFHKIR